MTAAPISPAPAVRDHPGLVPVLVGITFVVSTISSLGAPLIPSISDTLGITFSEAQWSLTSALLAGAVAAPILGRLGDGRHRRPAILGALAVVSAGGIVAGAAGTLWLLIVGRVMQGIGLGLAPIGMATARDQLDGDRSRSTIALLSVTGAAGVGAGYPISGLIDQQLGVHAAFFFGSAISGVAFAAALFVIPKGRATVHVPLDLTGSAIGGIGVIALLTGVAEGETWGWGSARVVSCFAVALVVLVFWVRTQLRAAAPLVDLRLLRHRAVLGADLAAVLLGITLYIFLTVVTEFVQTPATAGFGFGGSTAMAGVCLIPFSILSLLASRTMTGMTRRAGTRTFLVIGSLAIALSGAFFALLNAYYWQACVMTGLLGIGFGFTFAALPGLITRSVPPEEAGSAMGFYQVVRSIGFSIGSAMVASILAAHATSGYPYPQKSGYVLALWVGAAICVIAAGVAMLCYPSRADYDRSVDGSELNDAELAAAGIPDARTTVVRTKVAPNQGRGISPSE